MRKFKIFAVILVLAMVLCGCSASKINPAENKILEKSSSVSADVQSIINTADMFTERDKNFDYSQRTVSRITLKDNASKSESENVKIDGNTITIKADGVYVLSGKLTDGQIVVDAPETAKVQLVLDGVSVNCNTSAAIYCRQANKLFVTTIGNSTLSKKEELVSADDENINGVICSKCDLTLNGNETLTVDTTYGNAVVSKDDLMLTSGKYILNAQNHCLKANDSVRITNADVDMTATKDGIHCDNEDVAKGYIYIESGSLTIDAQDEGIQSSSAVLVCGGNIDIQSKGEGIEGRYIEISGGKINIVAGDDGINATDKSQAQSQTTQTDTQSTDYMPKQFDGAPDKRPDDSQRGEFNGKPPEDFQNMPEDSQNKSDFKGMKGGFGGSTDCSLTICGGEITVNADGDGVDSNGTIVVSGGNTVVYGAQNGGDCAFDYQVSATITGGKIIAIGMSGMAENFSEGSSQGSILYNLDYEGNSSDTIELIKGGETIMSSKATKKYNSVLISCPKIEIGEYTLKAGDKTETITTDSLQYSNSTGGFGMRGDKFKAFANGPQA